MNIKIKLRKKTNKKRKKDGGKKSYHRFLTIKKRNKAFIQKGKMKEKCPWFLQQSEK